MTSPATRYSPSVATRSSEDGQSPPRRVLGRNTGIRSMDAAKRKRERDKNSQRRKRERDRAYTESLEERIRLLEGLQAAIQSDEATHHGQPLNASPSSVHHVNFNFDSDSRARTAQLQSSLSDTLGSTVSQHSPSLTEDHSAILPALTPRTPSSQCDQSSTSWHVVSGSPEKEDECRREGLVSTVEEPLIQPSNSAVDPLQTVTVPLQLLEGLLAVPEWLRLPLHGSSLTSKAGPCVRGNRLPSFIEQTRADPNLKDRCPARPKVIDIMFGGSKNPLANLIVTECSKEALLSPEKLAISWALYLYCRWLIWPSQETFAAIPKHIHPSALQLTVEHPWPIDLALWPEIRENMIRHQSKHDIDAAIGLLLCASRVRGSFNSNFITRQNDGDLEVDAQFYKRFIVPEQWGLMETFWVQYPDLVEGLDPSVMIREEDLLAP